MRWLVALSIVLPVAAGAGGVLLYVQGHHAVVDAISDTADEFTVLTQVREAPDLTNLQKGDLCSVAHRTPDTVPSAFRLDVAGATVAEEAAARRWVAQAMPLVSWSTSASATPIYVEVVAEDLHFEGDDIAGVACGMDVLIEADYLLSSTLPHEVGHVLGLDHEDGSYMQIGRDPETPEAWQGWTLEQQLHLQQFRLPGTEWPERLS